MTQSLDLNDPIAVLLAASEALSAAGIEAAAYGGLALAVYGEPRETRDADLALSATATEACTAALEAAGLEPVVTFDQMCFGGHRIDRITLLPGAGGTGLNTVDLVVPGDARYAREALERAVAGELRGRPIRVLSPEDFVLFKLLSTRERDLEDAAIVMRRLASDLDSGLIEQEVARLGPVLPEADLEARYARCLAISRQ